MKTTAKVWERAEAQSTEGEMSKGAFASLISLFTLVGIGMSLVSAQISKGWTFASEWHMIGFCVAVLAVAILGVVISTKTNKPVIAFLGYSLVTVPFGLLLGPMLALYTQASIVKVLIVTLALVAAFGLVGALIPKSLEGWGRWVFGGLVVLLVGYLIVPIAGAFGADVGGALTWLDWIGVAFFSLVLIYDWNRAMRLPRTANNAVQVAVAIYLDWSNIFVRLLALLGIRTD